ncbi:hypothetical protein Cadr_000005216 [Camelus dromedarius]|uniref:Uncharacterized protein n=1 Tax=Camelus dromedarius TaxID=9838 RepID=A0A5N4E1L5_CAMDR|nr:hypothetical protein Cadr_000005216 [Camelus dromedarius]
MFGQLSRADLSLPRKGDSQVPSTYSMPSALEDFQEPETDSLLKLCALATQPSPGSPCHQGQLSKPASCSPPACQSPAPPPRRTSLRRGIPEPSTLEEPDWPLDTKGTIQSLGPGKQAGLEEALRSVQEGPLSLL